MDNNNPEEIQIAPNIIIPNKMFLVGALYGFNAARKRIEENPQPLFGDGKEVHEANNNDLFLGSWLELTCAKCGRLYTFEGPNEIPEENLKCDTIDCDNVVILYGVIETNLWRIGSITF